jgi:hypothetical protein
MKEPGWVPEAKELPGYTTGFRAGVWIATHLPFSWVIDLIGRIYASWLIRTGRAEAFLKKHCRS